MIVSVSGGDMVTASEMYEGSCLCGGVKIRVIGQPIAAGFCHCASCRTWHAAPVNAFATWPKEAVSVTLGEDLVDHYKSDFSNRHWCRCCGSGLMNHLANGKIVVYAMVLAESGYVHKATCHINCDETVLNLQDGLPKYVDIPAEWGGSGETVSEPSQTGISGAG